MLGRYAYAVTDELVPLATANDGLTPQQALERWLDDETPKVRSAIPIVWEPHGDHAMQHDRIEVPRITRAEFAIAEDVLRKFPAIAHGSHAWSFEPLPKGVTNSKAFVHIESIPGVQLFGETAVSQGIPVAAVWALPTVAFNGYGRGIAVKVLALAPGFCGVYTVPANGGPTKGMVSVVDTEGAPATVARSLYPVLEKEGFFASEQAPKAWRIVGAKQDVTALGQVLAEGMQDPKLAGFFDAVAGSIQTKPWATFIAENVKRLPRGGEQDLWATFPQPFPLGKVLRGATVAVALVAAVFAIQGRSAVKNLDTEKAKHASIETAKGKALDKAQADLAVYERFQAEVSGKDAGSGTVIPRGRAALLNALHEKVLENYTLTGLTVAQDGALSADFFQVVDGPDAPQELTNLRNDLQRAGFANCNIQPVGNAADRENGPGLATKHRYHLTAQYTSTQ